MKKNVEKVIRTDSLTPSAEILRENRRFYGLTQAQCAALIHVTTNTWSQWERGVRIPHPAFTELFAIKASKLDISG